MILDEQGVKLSKKFGNFKDPMGLLHQYGSDTLRLYLLSSVCVKAEPLLFSETAIDKLKYRRVPYINSVKFFLEHAMNYIKKGNELNLLAFIESKNITDRWVISRVASMIESITTKFESYQIDSIVKILLDFIDDLTNWYVKFNRDRLKGLCGVDEWSTSLSTLFTVQLAYCQMLAPFTPYQSELIYQHLCPLLPEGVRQKSVHLCSYPSQEAFKLTKCHDIEIKFLRLQQVAQMIRKLRGMAPKFSSVRVPIKSVSIMHYSQDFIDDVKNLEDLIAEEVNCLSFEYKRAEDCIMYAMTPNKKSLGSRYKNLANSLRALLMKVPQSTLKEFTKGEIDCIRIMHEGEVYSMTSDDFDLVPQVIIDPEAKENMMTLSDGPLTVTINTKYDAETHHIYQVRRFIIHVQNMRKKSQLLPLEPNQCLRNDR